MNSTYFFCLFLTFALAIAVDNGIYLKPASTGNSDNSRSTDMIALSIPGFAGLYYYSLNTTQNASAHNASASGVFGSAYTDGALMSWMAYFSVSSDWTGAANPGPSANVSKAAFMAGVAYAALEEVGPDGRVVQTTSFSDLVWNISNVESLSSIKYATFNGTYPVPNSTVNGTVNGTANGTANGTSTEPQSNFSVSFTFVVSNASVNLTTGAQLSPESVEAVINILNYNFTSNTSRLVLLASLVTATAGDATSLENAAGFQRLSTGSNQGGVYWSGSTQVMVDNNGTTQPVNLQASQGTSLDLGIENTGFVSQAQAMKSAQDEGSIVINYTRISIAFPYSLNLTYDPALGVYGTSNAINVSIKSNSALSSYSIPSFSLLLALFSLSIAKAL